MLCLVLPFIENPFASDGLFNVPYSSETFGLVTLSTVAAFSGTVLAWFRFNDKLWFSSLNQNKWILLSIGLLQIHQQSHTTSLVTLNFAQRWLADSFCLVTPLRYYFLNRFWRNIWKFFRVQSPVADILDRSKNHKTSYNIFQANQGVGIVLTLIGVFSYSRIKFKENAERALQLPTSGQSKP